MRSDWDATVYREFVNNPAFFETLGDIAGMKVLDVGCGEGYNTRKFADLGAEVVGMDVSRLMIAAALDHEADEPRGIKYPQPPASALSLLGDRLEVVSLIVPPSEHHGKEEDQNEGRGIHASAPPVDPT